MTTNWVFIRGLTRGAGHWGIFPEVLNSKLKNIKLIYLDLPGNGSEFQIDTPTDVTVVIKLLRKKLKLQIPEKQKVNICAISLGAMVVLKWAELYPNDFDKIFLINTSLGSLSPSWKRLKIAALVPVIKILLSKNDFDRERQILNLTSNFKDVSDRYLDQFSIYSSLHPVSFKNFIRQLILANKISIGSIKGANVTIISSLKDRLVDFSCSQKLSECFGFQLIFNDKSGHDLPLDSPDWLAETIQAVSG